MKFLFPDLTFCGKLHRIQIFNMHVGRSNLNNIYKRSATSVTLCTLLF